MKTIIFLLIVFTVGQSVLTTEDIYEEQWNDFVTRFNKVYESEEVHQQKKYIFAANKQKIDEHNFLYEQGLVSFELGVKEFMDEEHVKKPGTIHKDPLFELMRSKPKYNPIQYAATGIELPSHVDWRDQGIVTPVKNQHNCYACWGFAAAEALESQYAMKFGKNVSLSTQQLIDCSRPEGNMGCEGGWIDTAYQYVIRSGGLEIDSEYKFEQHDGSCRFNSTEKVASITNYVQLKKGSEATLQEFVALYGPVSVSINSGSFQWYYYKSGIYDEDDCGAPPDHAVVVVGYGTENGKDYWLVKNSYGPQWGDNGFIKMARNKKNQCEIASDASFPVIGEWQPKAH